MNEKDVEKMLETMGKKTYVNYELKDRLRKSFEGKQSSLTRLPFRKLAVMAAAVCLLVTTLSLILMTNTTYVSAADLRVENHVSVVNIEGISQLEISEYQGRLYLPIPYKGLFEYGEHGLKKLYEGKVNAASVSRDGKKIAFTENGSIKILNLVNGQIDEVLRGNNETLIYQQPSWLHDHKRILYTKRVLERKSQEEFMPKECGIYTLDLNTLEAAKIAEGDYASYIKGMDAVVFEREGRVIFKSLKDLSEKIVDEGSQPNVSPDGKYIAYTRYQTTSREIVKNAKVNEVLQNIWVTDTADFTKKQAVTTNVLVKQMDEEKWLKEIVTPNTENVLEHMGMYCYLYPTWSSDSRNIYALKKTFPTDLRARIELNLIKISFSRKELSAKETVSRYLQAVATGMNDYANGLAELQGAEDNKAKTIEGFKVTAQGKENGRNTIDVEVYWSGEKTADTLGKCRYYLQGTEEGYIIKEVKILDSRKITEEEKTMFLEKNQIEKVKVLTDEEL